MENSGSNCLKRNEAIIIKGTVLEPVFILLLPTHFTVNLSNSLLSISYFL